MSTLPAREALARLSEGNRRFAADVCSISGFASRARRAELSAAQCPIAVVLGCSDSRVPAEMVFDQGLGELFVIRVAGNVVAPSQVGSVEFAVERFATRLVVVMGHSNCGAVEATLEVMSQPGRSASRNLDSIVHRIRPVLEPLMGLGLADVELRSRAVRANVRAATNHLRHGSEIIERLIHDDGLLVVGAEYDLETGRVDFFDGLPRGALEERPAHSW